MVSEQQEARHPSRHAGMRPSLPVRIAHRVLRLCKRLVQWPGDMIARVSLTAGRLSPLCPYRTKLLEEACKQGGEVVTLPGSGSIPEIEAVGLGLGNQVGPTILMLHGWLECKEMHLDLAWWLVGQGASVWLMDFPAHGGSDGKRTSLGALECAAARRMIDYLEAEGGAAEGVVVVGFSMGASVALRLTAEDRRVCKVAALAPYRTLREAIRTFYDYWFSIDDCLWVERGFERALARDGVSLDDLEIVSRVSRIDVPILLIHGTRDLLLPIESHSEPLEAVIRPRGGRLVRIPGIGHAVLPRSWHPDLLQSLQAFCLPR